MFKFPRFAAALSAALLLASSALAQVGGGAAGGGQQLGIGQESFGGPPTLSGCGTSPSLSGNANAVFGTVNEGPGAPTGCTLTWQTIGGTALTRQTAPTCLVTGRTASYLVTAITTVSTTTLTWTNAGATLGVYDYLCIGS